MNDARRVGGAVYVGVTVLLAAVAAWPIYRTGWFVLLVAVAALVGAAIAVVAAWRRWDGWLIAGAVAAAILLLAVPLAVPSRLGGPLEILRGLGEALAGVVFGWKDLLTVDLPVGTYRNLLVPALVLFLAGTCVAVRLAWRTDRWGNTAVIVGGVLLGFGLLFGRTAVSTPLELGPIVLPAPVETGLGIAGLTSALLWLAWRAHDERVRSLHRAASASGVRVSRRPSRTDRRRTALGAGMLALALVAAVAVVPAAARTADREVLRSATGPERRIAESVSPLSDYRALFADERAEEVLFTVMSEQALPARVRLATLDVYDGESFRPGGDGGRFVRVPATLDAGVGTPVDATISIEAVEGIWMPTIGSVAAVEFGGGGVDGARAAALADGFYYNAQTAAGVQTADGGLTAGDAYRVRAVEAETPDLASIEAPGGDPAGPAAPDNLRRWIETHAAGSGGAALAGLVGMLRERGYLSHALAAGDGGQQPVWAEDMSGYTLQSSASGHSLARVDALFERLLERESDPRAAASGNFVAAIGDDEQFAVATALIAGELGFPARVVVGARLATADPALAACEDGRCRAQDLSAWTEVLSADGRWVSVDVTPQWEQSPSLEVTEQRDPENVTEVRPESIEEVVPPEPVQDDSTRSPQDDTVDGADLGWLWATLRIAGLVLLILAILLGPFIAIVGAKAVRRRGRRTAEDPVERIAGAWEEYVDAGVDAGRTAPRVLTRAELAAAYATPAGAELAAAADRAVFSREATTAEDAAEFWSIVDAERRALSRERGFGRRILAAVSLKSFVRLLTPRSPRRASQRTVERGNRRPEMGGRTTT